jgi:sugar/nucleoside kinase (ribokinase family)
MTTDLDVLSVGELLIDLISTEMAPSLRDTAEFRRYQGGSAANLALNVAKLGMRSALVSKVGIGAFGQHCKAEMSRYGVLTDYLVMDHHAHTTMVFVARTSGTPDFEVARQGDAQLRPEDIPDEAVLRSRLVHSSAFALSLEPCRSAVRHVLQLARAEGKILSLDPNYHPDVWPNLFEARAVLAELYPLIDLTKPSLDDAQRLFGPGNTPEKYVEMFAALGARTVVLTMGAQGVLLQHEGCTRHIPASDVEVADATGAGDAFWAGFLVAWLDGQPPERCVLFGREIVDRKLKRVGPLPASINRAEVYGGMVET